DRRVLGFPGTMRKNRTPARSLCDLDRFKRLRQSPDLIDLDEQRVGDTARDPVAQPLRVGDEQIVSDELDRTAELARKLSPAVPVILGHSVLDRHDRVTVDEIRPIADEAGSIEGFALSGEMIGAIAVEFAGGGIERQ